MKSAFIIPSPEHFMFKKYNDTPAAIAMGLITIAMILWVGLFFFSPESALSDRGMDVSAAPVVRLVALTWLGLLVGIILTFVHGPDGQKVFFNALLVAQIATAILNWYQYFGNDVGTPFDVIADVTITALLLFAYFRIRSRL